MSDPQFPPPGWWHETTVAPGSGRARRVEITALDYPVRDGVKYARYQLPENPIEPGSLTTGGYLFSNVAGELIDGNGVVAGTVDFTTGIMEIDLSLSPDPGARTMQYDLAV